MKQKNDHITSYNDLDNTLQTTRVSKNSPAYKKIKNILNQLDEE